MDFDQSTDGELLAEFAASGQGRPFEALLKRHQGLVMGTCVRQLGRLHDAEEVTQGVFLILAHKAGSLHQAKSIAGWLHRVAVDLCRNARKAAARRNRWEQEAAKVREGAMTSETLWERIQPILDEEVEKLPDRYRRPVMAYYLEQHTVDEIAQETGRTTAAVKQQLSRGRDMLRDRLARQGVSVSAVLVSTLIAKHAASAAMSPTVVASTVKAATLLVSGKAVGPGLVSSNASALVKGGLKAMTIAKWKLAAGVLFAVTTVASGGVVGYRAMASQSSETKTQATVSSELSKDFQRLYQVIKPLPGEYAWRDELPWVPRIKDARRQAAAEGKPILVNGAANGYLLGKT